MATKRADEIEIGDSILVDGVWRNVSGWFFDGGGRINLEYGARVRWHPHHRSEHFEVKERDADG